MSLVAYAASSDDDSECEDEVEQQSQVQILKPLESSKRNAPLSTALNGCISDEDEDEPLQTSHDVSVHELLKPMSISLSLPKPKHNIETKSIVDELNTDEKPAFSLLPMPKCPEKAKINIEEKDDVFLHKREKVLDTEKPPPPVIKGPVRIVLPSLKEFHDVAKDLQSQSTIKSKADALKGSGLLSILPVAKSERNFAKISNEKLRNNLPESTVRVTAITTVKPSFVPDSVKYRRPAHNTEDVDGIKKKPKKTSKTAGTPNQSQLQLQKPINCSDSEASDEEATEADFFSLNTEVELPQISNNEINAIVAKRAAKMVNATTQYLDAIALKEVENVEKLQRNEEELRHTHKRFNDNHLDEEAMQALDGSSSKRRRKQGEQVEVMEISSEHVLPSRDEWMRTALASSTAFQPTGVLVDEEPAAGTRRKHQITYLAHKAKANEAELQAMWAANRQNRRATQSKYGF